MLHIRSLSKRYHDEKILSVESLQLSRGIHLFKGDNGSGKTTFPR
jgi:ABC-type multidrug transport system ATPase subunit